MAICVLWGWVLNLLQASSLSMKLNKKSDADGGNHCRKPIEWCDFLVELGYRPNGKPDCWWFSIGLQSSSLL